MANLYKHAEFELNLLLKDLPPEDLECQQSINNDILDLVKVISEQGHSGSTIEYTLHIFNKLVKYQCITPLTGEDSEWVEVGHSVFQNNRSPNVFKSPNTPHVLDALVWKDNRGAFTSGCSHLYINSFPFKPKTFHIDLTSKDTIENTSEFISALKYYHIDSNIIDKIDFNKPYTQIMNEIYEQLPK